MKIEISSVVYNHTVFYQIKYVTIGNEDHCVSYKMGKKTGNSSNLMKMDKKMTTWEADEPDEFSLNVYEPEMQMEGTENI